ncbi:hypothetical protein V8E53_004225 [Lactarius tabidus]
MFSLSKITLFSLISFATLALAMPAPEPRTANAKDLLTTANENLGNVLTSITSVTQSNDTADSISSIISEVQSIINELVEDLGGSSLSDSSMKEILGQVANVFETVLKPLSTASSSNSDLSGLLGDLVTSLVALVKAIFELVGSHPVQLVALLVSNGCAGIIAKLGLTDLIDSLDLNGWLSSLLSDL